MPQRHNWPHRHGLCYSAVFYFILLYFHVNTSSFYVEEERTSILTIFYITFIILVEYRKRTLNLHHKEVYITKYIFLA